MIPPIISVIIPTISTIIATPISITASFLARPAPNAAVAAWTDRRFRLDAGASVFETVPR
jgi:hypothetical protein